MAGAAAPAGGGVIEGRVLNAGTGEYLENARVTLEGVGRETLTGAVGRYVFAAVPAGPARRSSASVTLDVRLSRTDRISVSLQATKFDAQYNQRDLTFAINRVLPGNFSTSFTPGDRGTGAGTLNLATANECDRRNKNFTPSFTYRHDGPVWKAEVGVGLSLSTSRIYPMGKGQFGGTVATRPNGSIRFADIFYLQPRVITVTDGVSGAPPPATKARCRSSIPITRRGTACAGFPRCSGAPAGNSGTTTARIRRRSPRSTTPSTARRCRSPRGRRR